MVTLACSAHRPRYTHWADPIEKRLQVLKKYIPVAYFIPRHSPKAHMKASNMVDMYGVHAIRFQARARAPDLVLPPRETPRRYASMAQKEAIGASVRACEA